MDMKIALGSVAALGALVGGAMLAGRLGSGDTTAQHPSDAAALTHEHEAPPPPPPELAVDPRLHAESTGEGLSEFVDRVRLGDGGPVFSRSVTTSVDLLERFDADGDGVLSDAERQASREAFRAEREERKRQWLLERYDADSDGVLSETEVARQEADEAARQAERAERIAKAEQLAIETYDLDADGALSEDEKQAGRAARQQFMTERHEAMRTLFDADSDGTMAEDERRTMHESMGEMFGEMRFVRNHDADGDHAITASDLPAYMDLFFTGDHRADVDGNGVVNEADLADMQRRVLNPPDPRLAQAMAWFDNAPPPVDAGFAQVVMLGGGEAQLSVEGAHLMTLGGGGGHIEIQAEIVTGGGGVSESILIIEHVETRDD